jgi:hypothetical protein
VQVGDQLRARGSRSADGASFDAAEVVSGTFRNIAGTISSIDAAAEHFDLQDLGSKISGHLESQRRIADAANCLRNSPNVSPRA